jgi:ATP-dependent Clp protease ATP-binding subunit ClpA
MYERFTDRARKVMQLANQEAQRFNHEYIGTEHILLGLVREGCGVAGNVLKNLAINLHRVRQEIEKIVQTGPNSEWATEYKLPLTPRAKKVIEFAMEEARGLNHNYLGTEHLLLGLLRAQEGVAAQVLMNLGLTLNSVRGEVMNLLGHNLPDEPAPPRPVKAPLPNFPPEVRKIVDDLDADIGRLTTAKEEAVEAQDWERAATMRDQAANLERARFAIIREWIKKPDEPSAS